MNAASLAQIKAGEYISISTALSSPFYIVGSLPEQRLGIEPSKSQLVPTPAKIKVLPLHAAAWKLTSNFASSPIFKICRPPTL